MRSSSTGAGAGAYLELEGVDAGAVSQAEERQAEEAQEAADQEAADQAEAASQGNPGRR